MSRAQESAVSKEVKRSAPMGLINPARLSLGRGTERTTQCAKAAALGRGLLLAGAAMLLLLLIPMEDCFAADWFTSVMSGDEGQPAVVIPAGENGGAGQGQTQTSNTAAGPTSDEAMQLLLFDRAEAGGEAAEMTVSAETVADEAMSAAADEAAALHVIAVNLPETKRGPGSLELSLQIQAGSRWKTAGILLEYDYSKLRPIAWDNGQTPTAVPDLADIRAEVANEAADGVRQAAAGNLLVDNLAESVPAGSIEEAALAWSRAAVLETKAPGWVTAKPALSYRDGDKAYLYLAAEQMQAVAQEKDAIVATVRFAYTAGAKPSKDYVASALNFVETRADMKVAYASPVKGSALYQCEDSPQGETRSYYHKMLERTESGSVRANTGVPAAQKLAASAINVFTYVQEGKTANIRPTETKDYVSLTFYDWDDTLLGSRIVAKGEGSLIDPNLPENRPEYVNADGTARYTDAELAAMGVAPLAPEGNVLEGGRDPGGVTVTAINKAGYSYAGWVDYGGTSTPTGNYWDENTLKLDDSHLILLENLVENKILKTAYNETGLLTSQIPSMYEVTNSPFVKAEGGLRTTITVVRSSRRAPEGKTYLLIQLRPLGRGLSKLTIPLGKSDVETFDLLLPSNGAELFQNTNAVSYGLKDGMDMDCSYEIDIPAADIIDKELKIK